MYYQITEHADYPAQFNELPIILIGNEKAVLDFVNERNDGTNELIENMDDAEKWLAENGYELESKMNLIERLKKGEQIWIQ